MIKFFKKFIAATIVVGLSSCFSISAVNAAQVSQAQIEQFKKLPKAQQKSLASSMGIDLSLIEKQLSKQGSSSETLENTPIYARGTQFNQMGTVENERTQDDEEENTLALKPFGYELFANAPSTFTPTTDIAIPAGYILGPGDTISLQMFGKENEDYQLTISRDGKILIPNLGPFSVVGLSFAEMKAFLVKRIKERIIGVDVVVSVAAMRSMRIFVLGEAYKPGPYTLSSLSSITHALFAAGGINSIGSLRNIQLKRSGKLITTFDLYDLLIRGDSSHDLMLQSGDVVFIAPVGKRVFVDGEVRRPAIYEVIKNDTFKDVIAMAGGVLPSAYLKSVQVERYDNHDFRSAIDLDLSTNKSKNIEVLSGDKVHVKKASDHYEKSISLIGAVTRPGKYQWRKGQKITDLLPKINSHLLSHADLNYALVIREINTARDIEVLQFSLANAVANINSKDNLSLAANDKVVIFSLVSKLSEEKVSLDSLAYTQEDLFKLEKEKAKEKYKAKMFWKKYGAEASKYQSVDENSQKQKFINNDLAKMTSEDKNGEVNIRELALFSRQRLLLPIITQLQRQGSAGEPIQLVEVDGEVKFPGIYPLAINGRVSDLITAAGGVKASAFLARAEITRNQIEGIEARKTSKNIALLNAIKGVEKDNLLLVSKDRLNVHKIPSWSENHVVELRGEFVFPGKYTIRRGETLSDIVAKAGGLTEFAYAQGSVFSREKLKRLEQQNLIKLASDLRMEMASKSLTGDGTTTSYAEAQSLLADLTKLEPVGRLVINLPKVINKNNYDILLEDGDVLYVPVMNNSVNVIGQVQVTSSHVYDEAYTVDNYISQSGGTKKRADEERIYVISANGSINISHENNWFSTDVKSQMKPGDTVVVPLDSEYMNNLKLWSTATSILYNTAVAVAAISGF